MLKDFVPTARYRWKNTYRTQYIMRASPMKTEAYSRPI